MHDNHQITMIQCPDAHLFCRDCVRAQAGAAVGARQKVTITYVPFITG
jgi:hypothetical protein